MKVSILVFLLFTCTLTAQTKTVECESVKEGNKLSFFFFFNSNVNQDVTFFLSKLKGIKGYTKPIKKRIAPNSKKLFLTVTLNGEYSYSSSYTFNPFYTKSDIAAKNEKLKQHQLDKGVDINKGIVVFSKDDCSRCHRTSSYLLDNNIDFSFINISDKNQPENKKLMWSLLKKNGYTKNSGVTMPVVLVDGKISYSHDDLLQFLKTLKN